MEPNIWLIVKDHNYDDVVGDISLSTEVRQAIEDSPDDITLVPILAPDGAIYGWSVVTKQRVND